MDIALQPTARRSNPVHAAQLFKALSVAFLLGAVGLAYVFLKTQQFVLAEEIRQTERKIRHVQARNEVLLARVAEMSSRRSLQQRLAQSSVAMVPIVPERIARLVPPEVAPETGILRTAFNEESRR
jgi:hypothetical protein